MEEEKLKRARERFEKKGKEIEKRGYHQYRKSLEELRRKKEEEEEKARIAFWEGLQKARYTCMTEEMDQKEKLRQLKKEREEAMRSLRGIESKLGRGLSKSQLVKEKRMKEALVRNLKVEEVRTEY